MHPLTHILTLTIAPVSLYVAQLDSDKLFATLLVANPFSVVLIISSLKYLDTNVLSQIVHKTKNRILKIASTDHQASSKRREPYKQRNHTNDDIQIYDYYRNWLVSSHITFLFTFLFYTVASLQISLAEINILFCTYIILILMILNLKYSLWSSMSSGNGQSSPGVGTPLTEPNNNDGSFTVGFSHNSNESSISNAFNSSLYLALLANPLTNRHLATRRTRETIANPDERINQTQKQSLFWPSIMKSNPLQQLQSFTRYPHYLIICNILHMAALAIVAYLSITFSCSSTMSKLGTALLIPVDCSHVYDSETARISMFSAIYSAQIFLFHLVFFCNSLRYRE